MFEHFTPDARTVVVHAQEHARRLGHHHIGSDQQKSAPPGLYFKVSPTQGISDAMNALFLKVIRTPRITS